MKVRAKLTSKGQITIPGAVRRLLGVRTGDALEFQVQRGRVEMRPAKPKRISAGILKAVIPRRRRAPTAAQMDAGILRHLGRKHARR